MVQARRLGRHRSIIGNLVIRTWYIRPNGQRKIDYTCRGPKEDLGSVRFEIYLSLVKIGKKNQRPPCTLLKRTKNIYFIPADATKLNQLEKASLRYPSPEKNVSSFPTFPHVTFQVMAFFDYFMLVTVPWTRNSGPVS